MASDFDHLHQEGGSSVPDSSRRLAIVGGDGRRIDDLPSTLVIRIYPSLRYGGRGRTRGLFGAIRSKSLDGVLILIKFIDHSTCNAIRAACQRVGVRVHLISSKSDLRAALAAEVAA